MKKCPTLVIPGCVIAVLAASSANAQQSSATAANVTASVSIVSAIAVTNTEGLSFGQVVASPSSGTVTLTPLSLRSAAGGATLGNAVGIRAARFNVSGNGASTFSIVLPTLPVTITDGTHTMLVDTFVTPSATLALAGGAGSFAVGAVLHVGASQPAGQYAGTFDVSVAYE